VTIEILWLGDAEVSAVMAGEEEDAGEEEGAGKDGAGGDAIVCARAAVQVRATLWGLGFRG
jgi:hypothetical protein